MEYLSASDYSRNDKERGIEFESTLDRMAKEIKSHQVAVRDPWVHHYGTWKECMIWGRNRRHVEC